MLHIFAGEDEIAARKAFLHKKEEYIQKGYETQDLTEKDLTTLDRWLSSSVNLFADKKAFFFDKGVGDKKRKEALTTYAQNPTIELIILDTATYPQELKRHFPTAQTQLFSMPASIFTFLDGLAPSTKTSSFAQMQQLMRDDQDFGFFYMLRKRIRELLIVSIGHQPTSIKQTWQLTRLQTQAKKWTTQSLMSLYESLYRIEKNAKTSGSTFNLRQSLEIVMSIV